MTNIFQILIDSSKRTSGTSTNFTIALTRNFTVQEVELNWLSIPLSTYVIKTGSNYVYVKENGTTQLSFPIPPGNYSGSRLASAIQDGLNSASGGASTYTVNYSSLFYTLTFSATLPFVLQWSKSGVANNECGFQAVDTASATVCSSTQACKLSTPLLVNVSIAEFDKTAYCGSTTIGSTFLVPMTAGSGYLNVYEPVRPMVSRTSPQNANRLTIRLTDANGADLNLNGNDWNACITIKCTGY